MQPFQFSLQSVLNLREQEEKSARAELGKRTAECDRIRLRMEHNLALLDRFEMTDGREIDWIAYEETADFIRRQKRRLSVDLQQAEQQRQLALGKYREALNRKKVFEKLKERRAEEFRREQLKRESKILDDLLSSRGTFKGD